MKKSILSLALLTFLFNLNAQNSVKKFLFAGVEDAEKLTTAYFNPGMKSFIYGVNGSWYHTAKVHKLLGFDITFGASAAFTPEKDEIFNFSQLNLKNFSPSNTYTSSPTVAGGIVPNGHNVTFTIPANSIPEINGGNHSAIQASFKLPDGVKEDLPVSAALPVPMFQVGLGLPFKLETSLRFIPKVGNDEFKGELLGIGLKKEITSLLGAFEKLPLHVSIFGGYTNMKASYDFKNETNGILGRDQQALFELNAYTIEAIASLNFPFINFYGGFGYNGGSASYKMNGEYIINYANIGGDNYTYTLNNPMSIDFNASGFKTTLGTRLSLGFFKIFADYTFQEYNKASLGIAFSVR